MTLSIFASNYYSMLLGFLYNYVIGLLSFLLIFSIGKIILNSFQLQTSFVLRIFYSLILGTLFIVVLYSILKSDGKTILIAIIPIVTFLLYYYKSKIQRPNHLFAEFKKEVLWIISVFSILFLYQSFFFFDSNTGTIKSLFWDNYAYASYVDSLKIWGAETRYLDMNWFFPPYRTGLMPYHYPELWLSAFVSELSGISSIRSYYLITNSIIISIYFIGIASLLQIRIKNTIVLDLISFILLFVAGISFSIYGSSITNNALWFTNMSMMGLLGSKISFVYIFILLSFILFNNQNVILGYCSLLLIPFFSIGMLPGIWGGILLFQGTKILYHRFKINRIDYFIFGNVFLSLLFFGLFYHFFKSNAVGDNASKHIFNAGIFKNIQGGLSLKNSKIIISNFIVYAVPSILLALLRVLIFFLPFILICYSSIIKNWKLWFFSIAIILCGATVSTLCSGLLDASQFTTNLSVFVAVLIVIGLIELVTIEPKGKLQYIKVCVSIVLIYFTFSKTITTRNAMKDWHDDDHSFIAKVADLVKNEKNVICLVFLNKYDYSRQPYLLWYNRNDLDLITQYSNAHFIFSMGNPELCFTNTLIPESDMFAYNYLTPFNAWKNMKTGNDLKA